MRILILTEAQFDDLFEGCDGLPIDTPEYIGPEELSAVAAWVQYGGVKSGEGAQEARHYGDTVYLANCRTEIRGCKAFMDAFHATNVHVWEGWENA